MTDQCATDVIVIDNDDPEEMKLFNILIRKEDHVGSSDLDRRIRKYIEDNTNDVFWNVGVSRGCRFYANCVNCYRIGPQGHTCAFCYHMNPDRKKFAFYDYFYWKSNCCGNIMISPAYVESCMLDGSKNCHIVFKKLDYVHLVWRGVKANCVIGLNNNDSKLQRELPRQLKRMEKLKRNEYSSPIGSNPLRYDELQDKANKAMDELNVKLKMEETAKKKRKMGDDSEHRVLVREEISVQEMVTSCFAKLNK